MPKINFFRLSILILTVLLLGFTYLAYTDVETQHISDSVLRLHIVANSDDANDQELKLKVRDEVIKDCGYLFKNCKTASDSEEVAKENVGYITDTANRVIAENGFDYTAYCEVKKCKFPTKTYKTMKNDDIRLPSGMYNAVNIKIGKADGHNWWCVMYPPLCFVDGVATVEDSSEEILRNNLSQSEYDLITESDTSDVKIKFKIAEILGNCK